MPGFVGFGKEPRSKVESPYTIRQTAVVCLSLILNRESHGDRGTFVARKEARPTGDAFCPVGDILQTSPFHPYTGSHASAIVGDGENPVTLLFSAIPLLALAGAVVVRGRAASMALMMYWMAALQAVIAIVTYAIFRDNGSLITLVFAGLWILSGLSFGRAARS